MIQNVWLIPGFALLAFFINLSFGRRWLKHWTGPLAAIAIGASAVLSIGVFLEVHGGHERTIVKLYEFISVGDFHVDVAALVDPLSSAMLLVVTIVSLLVHIYSIGYMAHDHGFWRFFTWLPLFVFAMLILVLGDNYLVMFIGWEGVGLCSYLLIGFWFERPDPAGAAKKAFIMNRIGDWGFIVGMITTFLVFGSMNFVEVFDRVAKDPPAQGVLALICLAFFFGATGKSAQLPLYSWLPDAMEGPTPVSALIHAATMVTAGVYLVARSTPLFESAGPVLAGIAGVGALTAIFAATIALVQFDIKRVMAYSTVSQLGYMFLALGVGAPIAAMFHLITHAFFKALLFLGSGSVIHGIGDVQDMRRMGGLRSKMPITYWTMVIAGGALSALPPLAGFWSKDEILGSAFKNGYPLLWGVGVLTGGLTAFYVTRAIWLTFHGEPRDRHLYEHAHESPRVMTVPLLVLAAGSVLVGFIGFPPDNGFLHAFLRPAIETAQAGKALESGTNWGEFLILAAVSTAIGVGAIVLGLSMYARGRPDPAAVSRLAGPYYDVLVHKYYVDDLYDRRLVGLMKTFAGAAWAFDIHIIDGLVNRLGWAIKLGGGALRRVQTGVVGNYAFSIVAGLLAILIVYGGYATGWLHR